MFSRLGDIGFDVKLDGSITLNDGKVKNALANLTEIKKLFANSDLLVPGNNGIAVQMRALTDRLIGIDGTVSTRSEGLRKRIDLNQDRQEALDRPHRAGREAPARPVHRARQADGRAERPAGLRDAADQRVQREQQQQQLIGARAGFCGAAGGARTSQPPRSRWTASSFERSDPARPTPRCALKSSAVRPIFRTGPH